MGFTLEHIHRTIHNLGRLMPAKPNKDSTREYSLKEAVFLMAPQLLEKREMGCTAGELAKALQEDGVAVKAPTLNRYLCEYQKAQSEEPETKKAAKKPAATAVKSVAPSGVAESAAKPEPPFGLSAKSVRGDSAPIRCLGES